MESCCWDLEKLKKEYEKLKDRYNLPSFVEINEDFEIEKLQERETDLLIREVRRIMVEKNSAYLRFIEMFLNPGNAPMFFFSLVKNMDHVDKKTLEELYGELGKFEILSLKLDNEYNEEKEAEFIKKFYKDWQEIKKKFGRLLKAVDDSWEKKSERKEKGYLG